MSSPYEEGKQAHLDGKTSADNPYPSKRGNSISRINWFNGFWDERHIDKFKFAANEIVGETK